MRGSAAPEFFEPALCLAEDYRQGSLEEIRLQEELRADALQPEAKRQICQRLLEIRVARVRSVVPTPEQKATEKYRRALDKPLRRAQLSVSALRRVRFSSLPRKEGPEILRGMSANDWVLLIPDDFETPYILFPQGRAAAAFRRVGAVITTSPEFQKDLVTGKEIANRLHALMENLPQSDRRRFEERERQMTRGLTDELWPRERVGRPRAEIRDPRPDLKTIAAELLALRNLDDSRPFEVFLHREIGLDPDELGKRMSLQPDAMAQSVGRLVLACRRKPELYGNKPALTTAAAAIRTEAKRRSDREKSSRILYEEYSVPAVRPHTRAHAGNPNPKPLRSPAPRRLPANSPD